MEKEKNMENNIVAELKRQLGRMMVQVDFMLKNDRAMSQLDIDIMMDRTREIYELLCDYQAEKEYGQEDNVQSDNELEITYSTEDKEDAESKYVELEIEGGFNEKGGEEVPDAGKEREPVDSDDGGDDFDDEDWEDEDDVIFSVNTPQSNEEEEMKETAEDLEETIIKDNSLATHLKFSPILNIKDAIGLNDRIMLINDLFKGSVERFNKAIDTLNDFLTITGARIYMSELQVELQWDVESQAYQTLNDLVERRYIKI
ncbi:MAG: hypothetical protein ACI358_05540 [Candidatus Limimorpha sp.]